MHRGLRLGRRLPIGGLIAAVALIGLAVPAAAQFGGSPGYEFMKAVKDRDGTKVTDALGKPGNTVLTYREDGTGDTALHVVAKRRDMTWLQFLLAKGADPNLRDAQGNTPLMDAVRIGFSEGVQVLIDGGARVDVANDSCETPLIVAVQAHDIVTVRNLLTGGANPLAQDHVAGLSAVDYARRDGRSAAILKLLQETKPVEHKAVAGPTR
jgi:ankyrin repeat protein